MRLSEVLLAKGMVSTVELDQAISRQKEYGGPLTDNLLALGSISVVDLDAILNQVPTAPTSIAMTGLDHEYIERLLVKALRVLNVTTVGEIRDALKLPAAVVESLLGHGARHKYLEESGPASIDRRTESSYRLTQSGKAMADEALDRNQYVGPAPVSLHAYQIQVEKQAIGDERISPDQVTKAFSDIVTPDTLLRRIGPALNSGKSILLYGLPGNGKTTVAERIGKVFEDIIFIPYCIEVGGEIIRVLDPSLHEMVNTEGTDLGATVVRREGIDARWVACKRPFIMTGGELSLEMLDLSFNDISKFYEMPVQLKAQGGTFVVDDFGRQLVRPDELLNRWIMPLERGFDFLKLHTGRTFQVPFDQLTIFSTNMSPEELMDPAFLRRIPYKLLIGEPSVDEFSEIFRRVCDDLGVAWSKAETELVLGAMQSIPGHRLACYQAKFIVEQVAAASRFMGSEPGFKADLIEDAVSNLYAHASQAS